jgi:tetratricopeptide (TPR) repeat protein
MSGQRLAMLVWLVLAGMPARSDQPSTQKAGAGATSVPSAVEERMREVWQANAQAPSGGAGAEKLRQAVDKLRAIELSPKPRAPEPAGQAAGGRQAASAPAEAATQPETQPSAKADAVALARLKGIPTTGVIDLVALADSLFAAGQLEAAKSFYELALERSGQEGESDWLLFQIGNCLREIDPAGARQAYKRLIEQCPDSPWKPVASTRDRLIEWQQINKPREFLGGLKELAQAATQPGEAAGAVGPAAAQRR